MTEILSTTNLVPEVLFGLTVNIICFTVIFDVPWKDASLKSHVYMSMSRSPGISSSLEYYRSSVTRVILTRRDTLILDISQYYTVYIRMVDTVKMTQITFDTSAIMYVCDINISYNNKDIEQKVYSSCQRHTYVLTQYV